MDNGLTVLSEKVPYVRSVAVGIWIKAGSRHEPVDESGIAHFVEHMLFKGTETRSAKDIAEAIERVGGSLNAFTTKEYTCVHARTLDEHAGKAMEIISDMVKNPAFDPEEFEKERAVVLDEIRLYLDTPDDVVHDLFAKAVYPVHPVGRPVLGEPEAIEAVSRDRAVEFWRTRYSPTRSVLAAAGNIDHEGLVELAVRFFGDWVEGPAVTQGDASPGDSLRERGLPAGAFFVTDRRAILERPAEQVHVCAGGLGFPLGHDRYYDMQVLNEALGGGSSSRLFQRVREELGLCYSIYSYPSSYTDSGLFAIYCGLSPGAVEKALTAIRDEMERARTSLFSRDEIDKAKAQLVAGLVMALESTSSRASRLGKLQLLLGRVPSVEEVVEKIEATSEETVADAARLILDWEQFYLAVVGSPRALRLFRKEGAAGIGVRKGRKPRNRR